MAQIQYQKVALAVVMQTYAEGFDPGQGRRVLSWDYFVDLPKGVVIFEVCMTEPETEKPSRLGKN